MKKLFSTTIFTVLIACAMAQAPQRFSFQAVVRNNVNELLLNKPVGMRTTILQGNPTGTIVYQEFYYPNPQTNANGLVTLEIGSGFVLSGNFANINWANGPYFIKTEADPTGGTNYTITGTSQLMSVPYALHAKTAESITGGITENDPVFTAWDKSSGIAITEGQITDLQDYLTEETDPEFSAWDKSTGIAITEGQITDLQDYLTEETDPVFNAWDKSTGIVITEGQITDLQDYLTEETDPVFCAWDKSSGIAITEDQITNLQDYLTEEADGDPTNELQTVTQEDYQVTLSQDGGSFMTGVKSYTQEEIDAMTPYNGLTVHNATTNCINYYFMNNWFESCGTCLPQPTQAEAGENQSFTNSTVTATLSANVPEQGSGLWSIVSGEGGSFDDASLASANFTGQTCTAYTLAWTITNTCGSTTDNVEVSFYETPTQAEAGNDTIVGGGATSMSLYANTPLQGEGLWTILSGEDGVLDDETDPNSTFSGNIGETYLLEWKISTDCDTSSDTISVTFANIQIGEPYQGGIIAYILQPGDPGYIEGEIHGIIAAASDQSSSTQWGCYGTTIAGADGTALGTGYQNTQDIVAGCSTAGIAARICNDLEQNGYTDWYLPSKDELNKLYINRVAIGGFADTIYWSSSEGVAGPAWGQTFDSGLQYYYNKYDNLRVRAVRAF